jgi:hypothetical protein
LESEAQRKAAGTATLARQTEKKEGKKDGRVKIREMSDDGDQGMAF